MSAVLAVAVSPVEICLLILSPGCLSSVCKDAINGARFTEVKGNLGRKEA